MSKNKNINSDLELMFTDTDAEMMLSATVREIREGIETFNYVLDKVISEYEKRPSEESKSFNLAQLELALNLLIEADYIITGELLMKLEKDELSRGEGGKNAH